MKVLKDTCVIVDVLQNREPFAKDAQKIFIAAAKEKIDGFIAAKSVTDIYYLTHRITHSDKKSREVLSKLFELFEPLETAGIDCQRALPSPIADYEDAVLEQSARREKIDCIVTRNQKDFSKASVQVLSPGELLKLINS